MRTLGKVLITLVAIAVVFTFLWWTAQRDQARYEQQQQHWEEQIIDG